MEGLKPSIRYTSLIINNLVFIFLWRLFNSNYLLDIQTTHDWFQAQAARQINVGLTLRNWLFGMYIVEYEQNGQDRATYGQQVVENLAKQFKIRRLKVGKSLLYSCREFYTVYPHFWDTIAGLLPKMGAHPLLQRLIAAQPTSLIFQTVSGKSDLTGIEPSKLLNLCSFSHLLEFFKCKEPTKRLFYETETLVNNWSIRDLRRAMDSLLFERTGLSRNKEAILQPYRSGSGTIQPQAFLKDPYVLDFLGLAESPALTESEVEQAIINHLQQFLMEIGRGFCFEARQKRISFDNRHYRIDLVFYHRILKCHVLIDLKIGQFDHADAGQMNLYLNYFRENEMTEGDQLPIGIILCADKNESLVKYATGGLSQQIFVSKYLLNLPSEQELQQIIQQEQHKL
jgi:predicted nuclease of restriction endonuclease-like (RecB) superfamily